jgi:hypothetical protein
VIFPQLRPVPAIDKGDDDFVVCPDYEGCLIQNPLKSWAKDWDGVFLSQPGELSAQFLAYQDMSAGIYLASRDGDTYPKQLGMCREGKEFYFFHSYALSSDASAHWECPYPVAIGVTQGTWQDSADIYKAWAVDQPWCEKTLSRRDDIPEWWKEGPLFYGTSIRTYDETGKETGSYYPKILDELRYLKKQTGGDIVAMLAGWENHHQWTGGDCFPVFDEKNAKIVIPQIVKEGFRPFFFISGLKYTFQLAGNYPVEIAVPDELLSQFVVDKRGKLQVFTLLEPINSSMIENRSYDWCVGSELVKSFYRHLVDESSKLGVYVLQMDQTNYGAGEPCYSSEHGHVPGPGPYQTKDFQALLQDMRDYGKGKDPNFVLTHESPQEKLIPYLDGFHVREYKEMQWPRDKLGALGIPLFAYLYHEYCLGYDGDGTNFGQKGHNEVPWMLRCHALSIVAGQAPGVGTWLQQGILFNADPRVLKMVQNRCLLMGTVAAHYLREGRMLHSLTIDAPTVSYSFSDWNNGNPKPHEFTESSILTSSWQAPDGGVGHVFVNASDKKQKLEVSLDTRNAPSWARCDATIYRSEDGSKFKPLWKGVALPKTYTTTLAPGEVLFIEILKAK